VHDAWLWPRKRANARDPDADIESLACLRGRMEAMCGVVWITTAGEVVVLLYVPCTRSGERNDSVLAVGLRVVG
jgi:hypothetical protein